MISNNDIEKSLIKDDYNDIIKKIKKIKKIKNVIIDDEPKQKIRKPPPGISKETQIKNKKIKSIKLKENINNELDKELIGLSPEKKAKFEKKAQKRASRTQKQLARETALVTDKYTDYLEYVKKTNPKEYEKEKKAMETLQKDQKNAIAERIKKNKKDGGVMGSILNELEEKDLKKIEKKIKTNKKIIKTVIEKKEKPPKVKKEKAPKVKKVVEKEQKITKKEQKAIEKEQKAEQKAEQKKQKALEKEQKAEQKAIQKEENKKLAIERRKQRKIDNENLPYHVRLQKILDKRNESNKTVNTKFKKDLIKRYGKEGKFILDKEDDIKSLQNKKSDTLLTEANIPILQMKPNVITNENPEGKIILQEHQIDFLKNFLFSNLKSSIVYHDVGTGKTYTAVSLCKAYNQLYPNNNIVIITPPALVFNFIDGLVSYGVHPQDTRYSFYSYEGFIKKGPATLLNTLIIVDEAHNLRTEIMMNEKEIKKQDGSIETVDIVTKGTRPHFFMTATENAHKVILLTATPFINKPYDIENLLAIGEGRLSTSSILFGETISNKLRLYDYFQYRISRFSNQETARNKEIKFEEGTEPDINPNSNYPLMIPTPKYFKLTENDDRNKIRAQPNRKTNPAYVVSRFNSITYKNEKINFIMNIIKNDDKKYVIYTAYLKIVELVANELTQNNISFGIVSGEVDTLMKQEAINLYNQGKNRIIILTKAGSEGVNLIETRGIFLIDGVWNDAASNQIIARAVRFRSHATLPVEDRKVYIYTLFTIFEEEKDKIDNLIKANPRQRIELITRQLAEVRLTQKKARLKEGETLSKADEKELEEEFSAIYKLDYDPAIAESLRGQEKIEYLSKQENLAKDKNKYILQEILNSASSSLPSIDYYMFMVASSKELVIDILLQNLEGIPKTENLLDLPIFNNVFKEYQTDTELTNDKFIEKIQDLLDESKNLIIEDLEKHIKQKKDEYFKDVENYETGIKINKKQLEKRKQELLIKKAKINNRKNQEFFTPNHIIKIMMSKTDFKPMDNPKMSEKDFLIKEGATITAHGGNVINILEPSAGWGNIILYLLKNIKQVNMHIDAIEYDKSNLESLRNITSIVTGNIIKIAKNNNFLSYENNKDYDYVFMNPPFKLSLNNFSKIYIDTIYDYYFVMRAFAMLKVGGYLVAIVDNRHWKLPYEINEELTPDRKNIINKLNEIWKTIKGGKICHFEVQEEQTEWADKEDEKTLKVGMTINNLNFSMITIIKTNENGELDNDIKQLTMSLLISVKTSIESKRHNDDLTNDMINVGLIPDIQLIKEETKEEIKEQTKPIEDVKPDIFSNQSYIENMNQQIKKDEIKEIKRDEKETEEVLEQEIPDIKKKNHLKNYYILRIKRIPRAMKIERIKILSTLQASPTTTTLPLKQTSQTLIDYPWLIITPLEEAKKENPSLRDTAMYKIQEDRWVNIAQRRF